MNLRFWMAAFIALALDVIDFLVVGLIPLAGDVLDVFGIIILFKLIGPASLLGAIEFIPVFGDLVPSFLGAVVLSRIGIFRKEEESDA